MNESLIKRSLLIFFILLISFSCRDKNADNSLTIDAYMKLGMPNPNEKWDMPDYIQARNVLARLKWENPLQLPVKGSKKSGVLFDRMLNLDYLSFLKDSTITRSEKAQRISEFGVVYDYWLDVYTIPTLKISPYGRELIDIRIFNLNVAEAAFNLAREIQESDDPADVALQYGYPSVKRSYYRCLNNYLQPRSYTGNFSELDIERMVDSVHSSVMRNKARMDSSIISELKHTLRLATDSASSGSLKDKYRRLENHLSS